MSVELVGNKKYEISLVVQAEGIILVTVKQKVHLDFLSQQAVCFSLKLSWFYQRWLNILTSKRQVN